MKGQAFIATVGAVTSFAGMLLAFLSLGPVAGVVTLLVFGGGYLMVWATWDETPGGEAP